jgi:hypothetical protein
MNDRDKHKVNGQMNPQKSDPKANATALLFFAHRAFFKANKRSYSRVTIKNILNPFVNGIFGFARHTSRRFAKPKGSFMS